MRSMRILIAALFVVVFGGSAPAQIVDPVPPPPGRLCLVWRELGILEYRFETAVLALDKGLTNPQLKQSWGAEKTNVRLEFTKLKNQIHAAKADAETAKSFEQKRDLLKPKVDLWEGISKQVTAQQAATPQRPSFFPPGPPPGGQILNMGDALRQIKKAAEDFNEEQLGVRDPRQLHGRKSGEAARQADIERLRTPPSKRP